MLTAVHSVKASSSPAPIQPERDACTRSAPDAQAAAAAAPRAATPTSSHATSARPVAPSAKAAKTTRMPSAGTSALAARERSGSTRTMVGPSPTRGRRFGGATAMTGGADASIPRVHGRVLTRGSAAVLVLAACTAPAAHAQSSGVAHDYAAD